MTAVILGLIAVYLAASLIIGLKARKRSVQSSEDYFLASRNLTWTHLALTLFATWMSTFAFLGSPGFYYKNGVNWFLPHGFLVVGSPMLLWIIGRRFWELSQKNGYVTPGDLLADFYDSRFVRYLVAAISLVALVPYSLIQLVGVAKVLEAATNGAAPYWVGIVLSVLGISVYTYIGGMRAIVWTDIIQGILFGILMLVGAGIAIFAAGGFREGFTAAATANPEAFAFDPQTVGSPLTLLIVWTLGYVLLPHMWQRAYMAGSPSALGKSVVAGSAMAFFLIAIPSLTMGVLGMGFIENLADSDTFVPTLFGTFLPFVLPFVVLAAFAAGMSTVDSQLLSAASVVVRDIATPLQKRAISSQQQKTLGRAVVLILVTLITILAFLPQAQGSIILLASKGTGVALLLFVPTLGPLTWPRASKVGALAALLLGGTTLLALESGVAGNPLPLGFGAPIAAMLIQVPAFLLGSLIFPRRKRFA